MPARRQVGFRINVLVHNLLSVLKRTALPPDLHAARPKRLRFVLFETVGRLIHHAGQLLLRLVDGLAHQLVRLSDVRRRIGQLQVQWARSG